MRRAEKRGHVIVTTTMLALRVVRVVSAFGNEESMQLRLGVTVTSKTCDRPLREPLRIGKQTNMEDVSLRRVPEDEGCERCENIN